MKDFHINNRKELLNSLEDGSVVLSFSGKAPLRSRDAYYPFDVDKNFFYLTGIQRSGLTYAARKTADKWEEILFIPQVDPVLEKWVGRYLRKEEASTISGIETILDQASFDERFHSWLQQNSAPVSTCYLDMAQNHYEDHLPSLHWAKIIRERYPQMLVKNYAGQMAQLRSIKKDWEIQQMEKAISITGRTFNLLLEKAPSCSYEHELEAYLDFSFRLHGARHAFDTIAAAGKNATVLHYVDNDAPLNKGDLILFDFGARWNNYCADISRTFPVGGTFTPRQREVYALVLSTLKKTIEQMKPGVSMKDVNAFAKDLLAEGAIAIGLAKEKSEIDKYYYHGIGHPLGLDTHDVGERNVTLKEGMVYTCEPGLYIEEEGIGIRIEDNILITKDGPVNLSKDIIKEIYEIESFMKDGSK